jgi:hypothetical protein
MRTSVMSPFKPITRFSLFLGAILTLSPAPSRSSTPAPVTTEIATESRFFEASLAVEVELQGAWRAAQRALAAERAGAAESARAAETARAAEIARAAQRAQSIRMANPAPQVAADPPQQRPPPFARADAPEPLSTPTIVGAVHGIDPGGVTEIRIDAWSRGVERGGQATIDRCGPAALYRGPWPGEGGGTTWLAGHANCGFGRWARLPIGSKVTFSGPHGDVAYVVSSRTWVPRKSGSAAGLVHDDLILQTCQGNGTSLTYALRMR